MKVPVEVNIKVFRAIKNEVPELDNAQIVEALGIILKAVVYDLYNEGELFKAITEVT